MNGRNIVQCLVECKFLLLQLKALAVVYLFSSLLRYVKVGWYYFTEVTFECLVQGNEYLT